ncbi:hypothetical protein NDU88_009465 [Pleurodeles waltl]|uniref:Uncharacterized protein n=1 Tax=Pleurodeles waltl TaxID=8319 RepID=A0AAV7QTQ4_PLEWA|nr:hypothetical protein NDU88_009465 [Pleurodeles waltl]
MVPNGQLCTDPSNTPVACTDVITASYRQSVSADVTGVESCMPQGGIVDKGARSEGPAELIWVRLTNDGRSVETELKNEEGSGS